MSAAGETSYSYDLPGFPDFYDTLLNYFSKGNLEAGDDELKPYVESTLASTTNSRVVFLDLATGNGKVVLSLLRILQSLGPLDRDILIVATDMSSEMLEAARHKIALAEVPARVKIELIQAPHPFPLPEHLNDAVDFAYCAEGTWTHLPAREEQLACLASIKVSLKPKTGRCLMAIMCSLDVGVEMPLETERLVIPGVWDGGFEATSVGDENKKWVRRLVKQELQQVDERTAQPAFLVNYEFQTQLVDKENGTVVTTMNDGWTLRYCSPVEFCGLVRGYGMQVIEGGSNFPDEALRKDDWLVVFNKQ